MTAYYVLRISDLSDQRNHLYSVVHPDNWDQGEGLVAAHAADHGYSIEAQFGVDDLKHWLLSKDGVVVADAILERRF
ncbi:hypothetical protein BKG71_19300 [Mycobacteroides chelonae]|uniref:hypothetical protein n=1 Tax=Mycobacteroides chelonae TaxID=1774 RepID=UPI0008AA439C|nr:hypothetical protein [Mycobacteroides chelonae]OHT98266.1 hypothetical protein BKG71_19300 [Mycobacteroides chelonae]